MREFSFFSPSSNFEKEFHSRTFLRGYRDILTDFEKTLFQLCNVQYLFVRKLTRPDINNYFYLCIYIKCKLFANTDSILSKYQDPLIKQFLWNEDFETKLILCIKYARKLLTLILYSIEYFSNELTTFFLTRCTHRRILSSIYHRISSSERTKF